MTTSTSSSGTYKMMDKPGRREKKNPWYRAHRYKRQGRVDEPLLGFYNELPVLQYYSSTLPGRLTGNTFKFFFEFFYNGNKKAAVSAIVQYNLRGKYK